MEAALIEVRDEASASIVRTEVRRAGTLAGLPAARLELLVAAASELAFNQLHHARFGEMSIEQVFRAGARGLEVIASDRGLGIADAPAALAGRLTGKGLGIGLAAVRRAADEVDTDVRHLEGSCLTIRCWASSAGPQPEIAIEGRPYPGEPRSGDDGLFLPTATGFLAAVADGLGHGPHARVASARAMEVVREHAPEPLPDILRRVDEALLRTRGCALSLARYDREEGRVEVCGVGNIDTIVLSTAGERHSHIPRAGTVGVRTPRSPPSVTSLKMLVGNVLIMSTDGMPQRARVASIPGLARHAPVWIAHHLITEHARANDDALVLVAR